MLHQRAPHLPAPTNLYEWMSVTAVLTNPLCRVRPPAEPIPTALLNSPAASIFRHLVRMNDGQRHSCMKGAVSSTLQGIDVDQVMGQSNTWARFLAAANRNPAVNPDPERFDLERCDRRLFTFGTGGHGCPGEMIATIIARAGVEQLLRSGSKVSHLAESVSYRSSANTRIPLFEGGKR